MTLVSRLQLQALQKARNPRRSNICFNKHYFDTGISSRNHAYMLGFLYGDGSVKRHKNVTSLPEGVPSHVIISNQFTDIDILHKFWLELGSNHYINICWDTDGENARPNARLEISDSHFAAVLKELGCMENKCDKITFPQNIIPDAHMWDFIRGYFDADGCLSLSATVGRIGIQFKGKCHSFIGELAHFVSATANVTNKKGYIRNDGQKQIEWTKIDDVDKILQCMYHDVHKSLFMNRKHAKKLIFESAKHFTRKMSWKRKQIIGDAKLQENSDEFLLLCALIDMSCYAFNQGSRVCGHYSFNPSWIEFLRICVFNKQDIMFENWQDELKMHVTKHFRYNDKLEHVKIDHILASYNGWKHHIPLT